MEYIIMGIATIVIIVVLLHIKVSKENERQKNRKRYTKSKKQKTLQNSGNISGFATCPVCGNSLVPGQNLISKVIQSAASSTDKLCYVYGCPNCYPIAKSNVQRTCPVCKKAIEQDGHLRARMFLKTKSGKPHIIINGCENC